MLGSEERAILDFEQGWWLLGGAKDRLVESVLGLTAAAYYERLLDLIDDPRAVAHDSLTIRRVRSVIEAATSGEAAAV